MASSRKPPSDDVGRALASLRLRGKHVAVGLSGGVDSVVLLHLLAQRARATGFSLSAVHVHHGLSPNADAWTAHCRSICRAWGVPLRVRKVTVKKKGEGLEAAARAARYEAFRKTPCDVLALAHHLDDQAETVLMNLFRGAGLRGASGMAASGAFHDKLLVRPLLDVPREDIVTYARSEGLSWVEDESNDDEALTRNFVRRRVAPVVSQRFPRWREALARASRHFAERDLSANRLLREFLAAQGLKAPSEKKLAELVRQLAGQGSRTEIRHDGARFRTYRGDLVAVKEGPAKPFKARSWQGEKRLGLEDLGGELRFRRVRGRGFVVPSRRRIEIRTRSGGERLQLDARRPRRTLKNLFQEAGVPAWERERLPLLFCGTDLVWAPGLGVDARYQASKGATGWLAEWHKTPA